MRFAQETGKSSEPVCPGVTPGRPAPDHFLVSRATRKILSPFWGGFKACRGDQEGGKTQGGQSPLSFWRLPATPGGLEPAHRPTQKGVRIFRFAQETGKFSEPVCPGVTPGRPAPDYFLVSRAFRKILSPFWGARMYSPSWPGLGECAKSSALSGVPPLPWPPGLRLAWQGAPQKGVRILRFAQETGKSSEPVGPGVTPGRPAPDHLLVSRAFRKILSPFWGARMYSPS